MKNSGFRKQSLEEIKEKQAIKREKMLSKPKVPKSIKKSVAGQISGKKRKVKSPLKKLKEQLWKLCREIQIKQFGRTCYCCGAQDLQGSNCHLGHFIPSSICSTEMRYDLNNLRPSCYHCNINLSGNWIGYEKHLILDGIDIAELKQLNEDTKNLMYREDFYIQKISEYTSILNGV